MRKIVLFTAIAAGLLVPEAAHAQTAIVPAFVCSVIFGGNITVPAGSEVVVAQRWEAKTRGLVQTFLNAQTTTIALNGDPSLDISQDYDPIAPTSSGDYFTRVLHPTGVTLAVGESMTFELVLDLSHLLHDGFTLEDDDSHKFQFFGPGAAFAFPCTVTGI